MEEKMLVDKNNGEILKNYMFIFRSLFNFIIAVLFVSSMADMNIKLFITDLYDLLKDNFGSIADICFLFLFFGLMQPIIDSVIVVYAFVEVWRDKK